MDSVLFSVTLFFSKEREREREREFRLERVK